MKIFDNRLIRKLDYILIVVLILICIYGVVMVWSATHNFAVGSEGFVRTQILAVALGLIAIIFILFFDYNTFARFYIPIYIFCNILLVAVLLFGTGMETWGANRWLEIPGVGRFQPADFVKIGVIVCIARIIVDNKENINHPKVLFKIIAFAALPIVLIFQQPDLGTAMAFVFFTFGMLYAAGLSYKNIIKAILFAIVSAPIAWLFLLRPHQKNRILVFLNPELDPMGKGYQIIQSKLAVGSGMIFGKGLLRGSQTQYGFLPERHNDFIFSVIAEELGFIGVAVLILLYTILLIRCINIAKEAKDDFGAYLVIGNTFMLAFHIFANIAMTIGLMPVTGKPLPFVSYGGTFMLTNMMAIGIILNVNMRRDKINF